MMPKTPDGKEQYYLPLVLMVPGMVLASRASGIFLRNFIKCQSQAYDYFFSSPYDSHDIV